MPGNDVFRKATRASKPGSVSRAKIPEMATNRVTTRPFRKPPPLRTHLAEPFPRTRQRPSHPDVGDASVVFWADASEADKAAEAENIFAGFWAQVDSAVTPVSHLRSAKSESRSFPTRTRKGGRAKCLSRRRSSAHRELQPISFGTDLLRARCHRCRREVPGTGTCRLRGTRSPEFAGKASRVRCQLSAIERQAREAVTQT